MSNYAIPIRKFEFYPDKPKETSLTALSRYDNGKYTAVSKLDGYNLFICNEGDKIEFYSRTWKPLPVCKEIEEEWRQMIADKKIPGQSIINCEWMKYRAGNGVDFRYEGNECIYLLTPYAQEGFFVGHLPYHERRGWLETLDIPTDDLSVTDSSAISSRLLLPAKAENDFAGFYEKHKTVIRTEGIVICRNGGRLTANQNSSIKTGEMLKLKYRKGDDGRTEV
jgi:ATP-dependent DNA ligase